MGHTRLGTIPKSRKWRDVIRLLDGMPPHSVGVAPSYVEELAARIATAADAGFRDSAADPVVSSTYLALVTFAKTSRGDLGPPAPSSTQSGGYLELVQTFRRLLDQATSQSTDLGEIAKRAATRAVAAELRPTQEALFAGTAESIGLAMQRMRSSRGIGRLSQRFFGYFAAGYIGFFVSRMPTLLPVRSDLGTPHAMQAFSKALEEHCLESARIVREFSSDWTSKTIFARELDGASTTRFLHVAFRKLRTELQKQLAER